MSKESKSTRGGVGTLGLLGVAFIVLKLCHVIEWSWWWVTAPFWAPVGIFFGVLALLLAIFGSIWCVCRIFGVK